MKMIKNAPILPFCILSIGINVLYMIRMVPEWAYRIGIVLVMISLIVMYLRTIINDRIRKKTPDSNATIKLQTMVKPFNVFLSVLILIIWMISYIVAVVTV